MSFTLRFINKESGLPATNAEIESLFLNAYTDGSGRADLDIMQENGIAIDVESSFSVSIIQMD